MNQFINGSESAFADLKQWAQHACVVYRDERMPPGCIPTQARIGFEIDSRDNSAILLVDRGIEYSGTNPVVDQWFRDGQLRFSSFERLVNWIKTELRSCYLFQDPGTFVRWMEKLDERVRTLHGTISRADLHTAEREANTCEAMLSQIYAYAAQHNIDLTIYKQWLDRIEARLQNIQNAIESRKRAPRWIRVLEVVARIVGIFSDLTGIGQGLKLIGQARTLLLPPPNP